MDRLDAPQELRIGQELVSNSGWFGFILGSDGSFAVYRRQTRGTVWTPGVAAGPGAFLAMQGDGNFVLYTAAGVPVWATNTDGRPGAWIVMQDDGNLVVYDDQNRPLWASNSVQPLNEPTLRYVGEGGFSYNETSEWWKNLCQPLPCFWALQWPGYATDVRDVVIDGTAAVIQLWKGFCPKFLDPVANVFPGGVGVEVGVYRRIPGKLRAPSFPGGLSLDSLTRLVDALARYSDDELWWPFPELGATLECEFINPVTGETIFSAGPQTGYWLTKWMDRGSYNRYRLDKSTPARFEDFIVKYSINGVRQPSWPPQPDDPVPAPRGDRGEAAWQLLLS